MHEHERTGFGTAWAPARKATLAPRGGEIAPILSNRFDEVAGVQIKGCSVEVPRAKRVPPRELAHLCELRLAAENAGVTLR